MRYLSSGESHGPQLTAIIEGIPSGLPLTCEMINQELRLRQMGYGRGGRMKIETDRVQIVSGVRHGITMGSPITLIIENKDFENWGDTMAIDPIKVHDYEVKKVPRPGHADLVGAIKYGHKDLRNVLER
ncbi:MAG: chorismate synthase, partial [Turicibacter sp.]